jgi:FkbM family methyltransferase
MKQLLKMVLRPILSPFWAIRREISYFRGEKSYSQEGEDRVLASLLFRVNKKRRGEVGFYVDIGAHHPFRFSNTYLFYKSGWSGINVDAMPNSMRLFKIFRRRDINIECGIGTKQENLNFYVFNESAINTFDTKLADERNAGDWYIKRVQKVPVVPLSLLLENSLPRGRNIDFMSVDVEGMDLEVLQSNDWSRFRPRIILVEIYETVCENIFHNTTFNFLRKNEYLFCSKTVNTAFFVDGRQIDE